MGRSLLCELTEVLCNLCAPPRGGAVLTEQMDSCVFAQAQHLSVSSLSWRLSLTAKKISLPTAVSKGLGAAV